MERPVVESMTIEATCRCGRRYSIVVHKSKARWWFVQVQEMQWPYRNGIAHVVLSGGLEPTKETFLSIGSTRLVPLLDADTWLVDMEDGCKDQELDFGMLSVRHLWKRRRHLKIPVQPEDVRWLVKEDRTVIAPEGLVSCPGGLSEGGVISGEALEGDR